MEAHDSGKPEPGQQVEIDSRTMEEGEQAMVVVLFKAERPDEAGDTGKIGAHGESDENKHEPLEGSCS